MTHATDTDQDTTTDTLVVPSPDEQVGEELVDEELLVEEVSIDGMCGVY